jgi:hypothetical protein
LNTLYQDVAAHAAAIDDGTRLAAAAVMGGIAHDLASAYLIIGDLSFSRDIEGLMDRAATHIEAAYHLLVVTETVRRTAPSNVIELPPPKGAA